MARTERLSRRRFVGGMLTASAGAVLGGVTAARDAAGAASRLGADPARFAGAFVNWAGDGREHVLQAWEKWLKHKPASVLGVDFYGQSTWEDFRKVDWVPGIWRRLNPKRNVVWSMPLTITGTPLVDVADGLHDSEFEAAARAIAEAQPRAIIRLGWEMNLSQMGWFAKGQEADYIRAFRRVVDIFRRASSEFKFDWCPGWGPQEMPADLAYPGDDVVDYIGLDVYDFKSEGSVEERWQTLFLKAPFGLEWHRDFAARHGKRVSFPEWGVGHAGDNPYFIQKMYDWFVENQHSIAYAAYFNVDGLWPTQIDTGRFPESEKLFRKLFGAK
ncbi:glycoside hydrolase family 26 protein [Bradyrhizobium sp. USDA 10063]